MEINGRDAILLVIGVATFLNVILGRAWNGGTIAARSATYDDLDRIKAQHAAEIKTLEEKLSKVIHEKAAQSVEQHNNFARKSDLFRIETDLKEDIAEMKLDIGKRFDRTEAEINKRFDKADLESLKVMDLLTKINFYMRPKEVNNG